LWAKYRLYTTAGNITNSEFTVVLGAGKRKKQFFGNNPS
jgi:hypothetical protein